MLFLKVFPFKLFGVDLVEVGGEETFSGISKESNEFPFRVLCLVLLLFIVVLYLQGVRECTACIRGRNVMWFNRIIIE